MKVKKEVKSIKYIEYKISKLTTQQTPDEIFENITKEINELESQIIKQPSKDIKSISIDINGCRRNILRHNKFDFPLFNVLDQFEIYDGQTQAGKYYVETKNYMPLRGNGFYFYPTIKYCLELGIIEPSDIKYCLLSKVTTPHDYFNDFIDFTVANIEESKLAINSLIGSFAVSKETKFWKSTIITESLTEAHQYFYNNNGCFIDVKQCERGLFYNVYQESNSINVESE